MIRVFRRFPAVCIDNVRLPVPMGSLVVSTDGSNVVTVQNAGTGQNVVSAVYTQIGDQRGNGFDSANDCVAYLNTVFAFKPSNVWQDVFEIVQQDVIPSLTYPWSDGPGSFANVITGADTHTDGDGVVSFTVGSQVVSFDPTQAGYHLNPGEIAIVQYTVE